MLIEGCALPLVPAPVLAVAGSADRLLARPPAVRDLLDRFHAADRELIVAGRGAGFSRDFDHPGLMIGGAAREEIWPRILQWLHVQETGRQTLERHQRSTAEPAG